MLGAIFQRFREKSTARNPEDVEVHLLRVGLASLEAQALGKWGHGVDVLSLVVDARSLSRVESTTTFHSILPTAAAGF
jgi:hypothetical protein